MLIRGLFLYNAFFLTIFVPPLATFLSFFQLKLHKEYAKTRNTYGFGHRAYR